MTYLKLKLNQIRFLKAKIKSRTTHSVAQNIKHHYYETTGTIKGPRTQKRALF